MNTNFNKNIAGQDFLNLIMPENKEEKITFEAQMIHLDFIERLKELMENKGIKTKKELADLLGTSQSYVTQIFSGEKLLNLKLLAKLQNIFGTKYLVVSEKYLFNRIRIKDLFLRDGFNEFIPSKINNLQPENKKIA